VILTLNLLSGRVHVVSTVCWCFWQFQAPGS